MAYSIVAILLCRQDIDLDIPVAKARLSKCSTCYIFEKRVLFAIPQSYFVPGQGPDGAQFAVGFAAAVGAADDVVVIESGSVGENGGRFEFFFPATTAAGGLITGGGG